jgi:hypothetical protein
VLVVLAVTAVTARIENRPVFFYGCLDDHKLIRLAIGAPVGFYAGWDQSFFWGTPDSGLLVNGRLFASNASGSSLWSGGTTGPDGSLLFLPLVILVGRECGYGGERRIDTK